MPYRIRFIIAMPAIMLSVMVQMLAFLTFIGVAPADATRDLVEPTLVVVLVYFGIANVDYWLWSGRDKVRLTSTAWLHAHLSVRILVIYMIVVFFAFLVLRGMDTSDPYVAHGRYYVQHGESNLPSEISQAEYQRQAAYEAWLAGTWLLPSVLLAMRDPMRMGRTY
jgi:hypothetical protein